MSRNSGKARQHENPVAILLCKNYHEHDSVCAPRRFLREWFLCLISLIDRALRSETMGLLALTPFSVQSHIGYSTAPPYTETLCLCPNIPRAALRENGLIA